MNRCVLGAIARITSKYCVNISDDFPPRYLNFHPKSKHFQAVKFLFLQFKQKNYNISLTKSCYKRINLNLDINFCYLESSFTAGHKSKNFWILVELFLACLYLLFLVAFCQIADVTQKVLRQKSNLWEEIGKIWLNLGGF